MSIIAVFGIGYSAFIKPSTTNKIGDGGVQNIYTVAPSAPIGGCELWRVNLRATWNTAASKPAIIKDEKK